MDYKVNRREGRECLECGQTIQYGRSDKKFCCDACKNRWHNRVGNEFLKVHSRTIRILDKNYKILEQCLSERRTSISLSEALQWGFNPDYVTGVCRNKIKTECRCYDIKYFRSDTKLYHIERIAPVRRTE